MRKGFDALLGIVQQHMHTNVLLREMCLYFCKQKPYLNKTNSFMQIVT